MSTIDYSALTAPYNRKEAVALGAHLRYTVPTRPRYEGPGVFIDIFGGITFGLFTLMMVGVFIGTSLQAAAGDSDMVVVAVITFFSAVGGGAFTYWLMHRYFRMTGGDELWWRLDRFAAANGMVFSPWSPEPDYPSAMFETGTGVAAYNHIRREGERFIDIGNLHFQTGTVGMETIDNRRGFVAIHLRESWPSALLDAKDNDGVMGNGLPLALAGTSRLKLTVPGADRFMLWGTLTGDLPQLKKLFTAELIAALNGAAGVYDVHVVDDWLFLYSRKEFDMASPAQLRELFGLIEVVQRIA